MRFALTTCLQVAHLGTRPPLKAYTVCVRVAKPEAVIERPSRGSLPSRDNIIAIRDLICATDIIEDAIDIGYDAVDRTAVRRGCADASRR